MLIYPIWRKKKRVSGIEERYEISGKRMHKKSLCIHVEKKEEREGRSDRPEMRREIWRKIESAPMRGGKERQIWGGGLGGFGDWRRWRRGGEPDFQRIGK
jgi:hypothetical protein